MSKLTSSDIDQVLNARLNDDGELEFAICLAISKETNWIKATRISKSTMKSKLFQEFYNTIDKNINSPSDLEEFLSNNNNNHNSKNENENEEEDENDGKQSRKIELKLGTKIKMFDFERLQSLSYFKAMFSQRWLQNRNLEQTTIDIFGRQSMDNNINIDNCNIDDNYNDTFDFDHLEWLLNCCQIGKIPQNLPAICELLEGLIACHDFFMNKEDEIINEKSLIDYLTNVKPRLRANQRQKLMVKASNKLLQQALNRYDEELNEEMIQMRLELVDCYSSIRSINNIRFDPETSFVLLKEKFDLTITPSQNINVVEIKINNFTKKEDYLNLITRCRAGCWLSSFDTVIRLVTQLTKTENQSSKLKMTNDEYEVIRNVLKETMRNASVDDCNLENSVFESRLVATYQVLWRATIDQKRYWCQASGLFAPGMAQFSSNAMEKFVNILITKHDQCSQVYRVDENASQDSKEKQQRAFDEYYKLWQICLIKCSHKWIVENASSWFPIIHKNDKNSVKWILNDIVNDMNGKLAFSFGIYLTKYISYEWDSKQTFPRQYLDFLCDDLGIDWQLVGNR